jgi:hypothetical protein
MITLSCYHYIFIMLAWQGYHVIMTGWSCYHYRVIMLSWYRYHVIWQGYHTILMTLLCYLERIILSWQHYHFIMIKCYQSRLSCIKIALLREKCMINYYHNNMIVFMITFNHVRYFFPETTSLDWKISLFGKSQCSAMACCWETRVYWLWNVGKTVLAISKEYYDGNKLFSTNVCI